jgi:hypothetical protein
MAAASITGTASPVTAPNGTPVTMSAACTFGITQAGAASGPSVSTSMTWPSLNNGPEEGTTTLWVATASSATLNYVS